VTDHASSAPFEPAPNIYTVRQSPQSTDGIPMVPTNMDLERTETTSVMDQTTTRPDAFSRCSSQENPVSSKFYAFARQVPADPRKIDTVYSSSTSTTKTIVYSSGSAGENVRATNSSQRKLITVAMPVRYRMLASTLSRAICPPLAVTAWFWRVPCGLCDLDAPTLAQPDIVPHRS